MHNSTHAGAADPAPVISGAGLRRTSPESVRSDKLARAYHQGGAPDVSRISAMRVAKQYAIAARFNPAALALLDQLFACSKSQDWTHDGGVGPIVHASNAWLARKTNQSERSVTRQLDAFSKAGLISYNDSATFRRYGRRDATGRLVEAFGIDLSPIAMRHDELRAIAAAAEADAKQIDRLKKRRTALRSRIKSLIASALTRSADNPDCGQQWQHAWARLDAITERKPQDLEGFAEQVADLEAHDDHLRSLFDDVFGKDCDVPDLDKMGGRGSQNDGAITITASKPDSEYCSQSGIALTSDTYLHRAAYGSMAFEKKPGGNAVKHKQAPVETQTLSDQAEGQSRVDHAVDDSSPPHANTQPEPDENPTIGGDMAETARAAANDDVLQLSIGLLREACPAIKAIAPDALDHWQILRNSGHALCAGTDINPQVFEEASQALGPDIAIAATAVTVQKAAQGDVFKPGAYLRTLTKRGKAGQLHIAKSLHGLAERNAVESARSKGETASTEPIDQNNTGKRSAAVQKRAAKSPTDRQDGNQSTDTRQQEPKSPVPQNQVTPVTDNHREDASAMSPQTNGGPIADHGAPPAVSGEFPTGQSGRPGRPERAAEPTAVSGPKQAPSPMKTSTPVETSTPVGAAAPFPRSGTIAYSPWADIVRQNAPEPVPDVDRIADAFRAFCNRNSIDTTSPNITTVFTTFCSKWQERQ